LKDYLGKSIKTIESIAKSNSWWSAENDKFKRDYAAGLYDLADLVDEDAVLNTVIADIRNLVEEWSS
jgi:hypothetical protein